MKKMALISIFTLLVTGIWLTSLVENETHAISGCCKQRNNVDEPWYRTGTDIEACKNLNETEEDVLFNESGKVWWDLAC